MIENPFSIFLLAAFFKILLIPSYFSTDFEVHRNWLAITNSLPLHQWYYDTHSENSTLDYPPLFAYFEYFLSLLGCKTVWPIVEKISTSQMNATSTTWCHVANGVNHQSYSLLLFQRLTVIFISDVIYFIGCFLFIKQLNNGKISNISHYLQCCLLYLCPGLFIIDNIHFQYNGILFGILLFSFLFISKNNLLISGIMFAILLNFKHLFLYIAPAYFIFLLKDYCLREGNIINFVKRFITLGFSVIFVFAASFGPIFVSTLIHKEHSIVDEVKQILSRLFPFERGLTHAYWAPNVWAIYNTLDKILTIVVKKFKLMNIDGNVASLTGGLVGLNQGSHVILPSISPKITITLCAIFSFGLCLIIYLRRESNDNNTKNKLYRLLTCVVQSAFSFYMFGWHVHEKAILTVLIPMTVLAVLVNDKKKEEKEENKISIFEKEWFRVFSFTSIVGTYSLFPLLFQSRELLIKWSIMFLFICLLKYIWNLQEENNQLFNITEKIYLYGLIGIEIYQTFIHSIIFTSNNLPFLPLMIISFYTSFGIIYGWIKCFILSIGTTASTKTKTE
ncbi:hypothetical protein ABK040_008917 [Willaertia magna]